MFTIPKGLAELENRREELTAKLLRLEKDELPKNTPRLIRHSKAMGVVQIILMLLGYLVAYLAWDKSFLKNGSFGYILLNIIRMFFGGLGIGALFFGFFDAFGFEILVAKCNTILSQDFYNYKRKRKTHNYTKHLVKSELGIVKLKIKEIKKGKNE